MRNQPSPRGEERFYPFKATSTPVGADGPSAFRGGTAYGRALGEIEHTRFSNPKAEIVARRDGQREDAVTDFGKIDHDGCRRRLLGFFIALVFGLLLLVGFRCGLFVFRR